jgi:hypothetical protein
MATPGQPIRVVVRRTMGDALLADVTLPYEENYTVQWLLIGVDIALYNAGQGPEDGRDTFWNCGHDLTRWHSEFHSWRFMLPGSLELIARDALVNDHLIHSDDGVLEFHLQATRVKAYADR